MPPPPPTRPEGRRRRRALAFGALAEEAAVAYLRCKGYRVLARRFLVRGGEIDIIARRGETIAFVEVKLRAALADAQLAIDEGKRRRMARAARVFIARHRINGLILRADAIYLAPWRLPLHVPAAFELPLE